MQTRHAPTVPSPVEPILSVFARALCRPLARLQVVGARTGRAVTPEKRQLIDDIRRLNRTATPTFLAGFDARALRQYLDRVAPAGVAPAGDRQPRERTTAAGAHQH